MTREIGISCGRYWVRRHTPSFFREEAAHSSTPCCGRSNSERLEHIAGSCPLLPPPSRAAGRRTERPRDSGWSRSSLSSTSRRRRWYEASSLGGRRSSLARVSGNEPRKDSTGRWPADPRFDSRRWYAPLAWACHCPPLFHTHKLDRGEPLRGATVLLDPDRTPVRSMQNPGETSNCPAQPVVHERHSQQDILQLLVLQLPGTASILRLDKLFSPPVVVMGSPIKALLSDRRRIRELLWRRGGKSNGILSGASSRELHLSSPAQAINFEEHLIPCEARTGGHQLFKQATGRFRHGLDDLIARGWVLFHTAPSCSLSPEQRTTG